MTDRHISWEEILAIVNSPEGAGDEPRRHLQACVKCVLRLESARSLAAEGRLVRPPRELLERTFARLKAKIAQEAAAETTRAAEKQPSHLGQR